MKARTVATFSTALREAREALGLTQAEVAERCGVFQSTVARWESGRHLVSEATVRLVEIGLEVRFYIGWERA